MFVHVIANRKKCQVSDWIPHPVNLFQLGLVSTVLIKRYCNSQVITTLKNKNKKPWKWYWLNTYWCIQLYHLTSQYWKENKFLPKQHVSQELKSWYIWIIKYELLPVWQKYQVPRIIGTGKTLQVRCFKYSFWLKAEHSVVFLTFTEKWLWLWIRYRWTFEIDWFHPKVLPNSTRSRL